jgi:putative spermidine/putrescine transport system substrate-binding protein
MKGNGMLKNLSASGNGMTRRGFVRLGCVAVVGASIVPALVGCGSENSTNTSSTEFDASDWNSVLAAARGTTVNFYGYGGDDTRNSWLDSTVAPSLTSAYGVMLNRVPMPIDDILTKLSGEMAAGVTDGSIDAIWINGENFYSCKQNGYLWGPFADDLPNYSSYVDTSSSEVLYDFGEKVDGYEAPYGKAEMVMWVDSAKTTDIPTDTSSFATFCANHKGQVTYPAPGDFTGTAFISCLIAGVIGKDTFSRLASMGADKDAIRAIIEPGLVYLKSLNANLWKAGATFPADSGTVDQMYADGELVLDMGYGLPQSKIDKGVFPATTKPFVLESGMVGNSSFIAIAGDSSNTPGAMVLINHILSPEMQASQYSTLHTVSVLDMSKLSSDQAAAFDTSSSNEDELTLQSMLDVRVGEASGQAVPLIEELWREEVVGQ